MKKILFLFLLLLSPGTLLQAGADEVSEATGLLRRVAPSLLPKIRFEKLTREARDVFELETENSRIVIRGNSANSMAVGLNHYLKYYCKTSVSWFAHDPTELPDTFPSVPRKIRVEARTPKRFFLNYCTFGYTMAWWQWKEWEHFIDWMALNGINMPLAITGQESVWLKVWTRLGLDEQDIRNYFTGPAHLPWHRMTNFDSWQGNLPDSWLTSQEELQKKIVARERALNMTPVLPAFAGHVPPQIKKAYPQAKINRMSSWGGFDDRYRSYFLDPLDPLFARIQKLFLEEQTRLYGTDHIYGADPFNEIESPSWEPDYLATVSRTIYETITQCDPEASWLQMTWLFYFDRGHWTNPRIDAFVNAAPRNKMILLDYFAENTEIWKYTDSYFGQPFIWCYLGNFGGNTMLSGNLKETGRRIEEVLRRGGPNFWGIGSTLESFDVNPFMYEYVFEKAWNHSRTDQEWISSWADRRLGRSLPGQQQAWIELMDQVYTATARLGQGTLTNARPSLSGHGNWTTNPGIDYDNRVLFRIWEDMLRGRRLTGRNTYLFDVVNLGRQVLGNYFHELRDSLTACYHRRDLSGATHYAERMDGLLTDLETLLATHTTFSFGKWLADASSFGTTPEEQRYYRTNARTLLTTWGEKGQSLNDYANRSWSGLTRAYYHRRWRMFLDTLLDHMRRNEPFDEAAFRSRMIDFEEAFTRNDTLFSAAPSGAGSDLVYRIMRKYRRDLGTPDDGQTADAGSTESFDRDWRFARFGLQADGSRLPEPSPSPADSAFDDSRWRALDLPHDWGIEGPFRGDLDGLTGKLPWRGIGWYRKRFHLPVSDREKRIYLDFDGAMAHSEVWINGKKAGGHPYGYTSFRVDLTPYVRFGADNVVAVRLDTESWGSRWYPGAGLYRHVRLARRSRQHIGQWGVFVTTPLITPQAAQVCVDIDLENHETQAVNLSYHVAVHPLRKDGTPGECLIRSSLRSLRVPGQSSRKGQAVLRVREPRLWSLETPHLYQAVVSVFRGNRLIDRYTTTFGIRSIAFTHDRGFLLNGRHVPLRGVCMHHDLGALGTAVNTSALERQLRILKSFGCNAIRTSHNTPAPELLDLADRMGFLIMDEAFDCWTVGKKAGDYATLFSRWHEEDLRALVCRDRNHPSVILWSTGNEVDEQYRPETGMARRLTEVVHRYDTTRPVTFGASWPSKSALNGTELQVDVHGMNYPSGCFGGPDFYGTFLNHEGHGHLAGFASETSSTMSSRGVYFPGRFQCSSYDLKEPGWGSLPDQEFAALEKYPAICGEFVWTGFDYLGEPIPFNSDQTILLNYSQLSSEEIARKRRELDELEKDRPTSRSSYFGIVDLAGFPKDRYYLYQSHWLPEKPMAHILPHWNFPERLGQVTPVFVYTSGDEAELFLNGRSLGRKKKAPYTYRLRWEDVVYEPGTLRVVAYRNGRKWATDEVQTSGPAFALQAEADRKHLRADGQELAFVTVRVTDRQGRPVPDACLPVTCEILSGDGELVATDNGDATCHISFSSPERPTFNGLLLAIVRARAGGREAVTLRVSSPGLRPAEVRIRLR